MTDFSALYQKYAPDVFRFAMYLSGNRGEAEDIANMAMFLLSDAAGWVTGQVINVDGGHLLRRGPDFSAMLEPVFGADGLRGVV